MQLRGKIGITDAAELKRKLLEALTEGKDLRMDLEGATEMDVTTLQLLWATEREARKLSVGFVVAGRVPEAISSAATDAGFEMFPVPLESK